MTLPISETITLKTLELTDAKGLFEVTKANDTHLRQWLGWLDDDKSVVDVENYIKESEKRFATKEGVDFQILENGQIIGGIALYPLDMANKKTSLMYWLTKEAEGKGIMSASLTKVIDYIFNDLKLNRIEISCATENTRSIALPKKLGFTFEGISREGGLLYDHFVDLEMYSLLSKDWKK